MIIPAPAPIGESSPKNLSMTSPASEVNAPGTHGAPRWPPAAISGSASGIMAPTSGSASCGVKSIACGSAVMAAAGTGSGGAAVGGGRGLQLAQQWRRRGDDDDDDAAAVDDADDDDGDGDDEAVAVAAVGLALPSDGRGDSGFPGMLSARHSCTNTP